MELYFIGLLVSMLFGFISITFGDDECNITKIYCIIAVLIFSILSWISVLIYILSIIRSKIYS
jgi:hypothetical protein